MNKATDPSGGTPDGAKRPLATPATPVDNNLREKLIVIIQWANYDKHLYPPEAAANQILALITHSNNAARIEGLEIALEQIGLGNAGYTTKERIKNRIRYYKTGNNKIKK